MSENFHKTTPFFVVLLTFLLHSLKRFGSSYLQIIRHPFSFFNNVDPHEKNFVLKSIEFAMYSAVLEQSLIFLSKLPIKFLQPIFNKQLFMLIDVCAIGIVFHVILRIIGKHTIYLSGTISAMLYCIGFFAPIVVLNRMFIQFIASLPYLSKISTFTEIEFGFSLMEFLVIIIIIPLKLFSLYIICHWISVIHFVRKTIVFLALAIVGFPYIYFIKPWIAKLYLGIVIDLTRFWFKLLLP